MKQKGMIIIMITVLGMLANSTIYGKSAEDKRRATALRLYQEGLFQETGTGNLQLALDIYSDLASEYRDIPDVAAVAYYHQGILLDKSGKYAQAREKFNFVIKTYPDQVHIIKRIKIKLKEMKNLGLNEKKPSGEKKIPKPEPAKGVTESDTNVLVKEKSRDNPGSWGIGVHTTGIHGRYSFGTKDKTVFEIDLDYMNEQLSLGSRLFFVTAFDISNLAFNIFPGIAIYKPMGPSDESGPVAGGFLGGEAVINDTWGIGADTGYYYSERKSGEVDTSIKSHIYATVYF